MTNEALSRADMKALARLLKMSLAGPVDMIVRPEKAGKDGLSFKCAQAEINLEPRLVDLAISSGLLVKEKDCLAATAETRAYLRRYLSAGDDRFLQQHGKLSHTLIDDGGEQKSVQVNLHHSPMAMLARLKDKSGCSFLPREALAAGERLHADFTRGQLQPRVTQSFEPRLSSKTRGTRGGLADISDSAMAARLRVSKALDAIGPELSGVALDVCCFMKGLETVERERQWPVRSAKLMLRTALMSLHRHYEPPRRAAMRNWGVDGFRPEL